MGIIIEYLFAYTFAAWLVYKVYDLFWHIWFKRKYGAVFDSYKTNVDNKDNKQDDEELS